jgi:hypothetical protein
VISGPYTKGSVKNGKRRFSSHPYSDEITMRGYRVLTFAKCTTIMIAKLAVTSGPGSALEYRVWLWVGIGNGIVWLWFWLSFAKLSDLY